jgi:hypothetical protein
MKRRIGALLTSLLLASLGTACMHNHSDEFKGESYATLKQQQIANPEAGKTAEPIEGIAATTADHVSVNYHQRQEAAHQDDGFTMLLEEIGEN